MLALWLLALFCQRLHATPYIAFPINAQVPPVARVSQPFVFQFAPTTFATSSTSGSSIEYTLDNDAPEWLQLDGATRTFSGTPHALDLGPADFGLRATDETGGAVMQMTFVIVDSSTPQATENITNQLSQFGTLSGPTTLAIYASTPFTITFQPDSFTSINNPLYYATSANRSPLPSWVSFDADTMTFSGFAPPLILSPQVFDFALIVTRVPGFAEAWFDFSLAVGTHKLVFQEAEKIVNVSTSGAVEYKIPGNELLLDGQPIGVEDLGNIGAQLPSWLQFDSKTMSIRGQAPPNTTSQEITVNASDTYGDEATLVLIFDFGSSLFTNHIGTLNVTAGQLFTYTINRSTFSDANVIVTVQFDKSTSWLHFDNDTLRLYGTVPYTSNVIFITATITASLPFSSLVESQAFLIRVLPASPTSTVETRNVPSAPTATASARSTTNQDVGLHNASHLSSGAWVGIGFTCGVVALLLFGAVIWCLCRGRNGRKPWISKPIITGRSFQKIQVQHSLDGLEKVTEQGDIERGGGGEQLPYFQDGTLNLKSNAQSSNNRSELVGGTVLPAHDEAVLSNITYPPFGIDGLGIHIPLNSRGPSADVARFGPHSFPKTRHTTNSPTVSSFRYRLSRLPRPQLSHASGIRKTNPKRKSTSRSTLPVGRSPYSDICCLSSVSKTPSMPDNRAENVQENMKKAWIRCVTPASEAVTVADTRPLADRRQSYIHHRASTNHGNPLFAASDALSKHASGAYRTPLRPISSNSPHRLTARAAFTRSKSSSIGVRTSGRPGHRTSRRPSVRSRDEWLTASSTYSDDDSELNLAEQLDEGIRDHVADVENTYGPDSEEERENKRNKWSHRLRRDGRGEIMDSITESDTTHARSGSARLQSPGPRGGQKSTPQGRLTSIATDASSVYDNDAFI